MMDLSAMTPASFVEKVSQVHEAQKQSQSPGVTIEYVEGSLDGSDRPTSDPVSFGPKAP